MGLGFTVMSIAGLLLLAGAVGASVGWPLLVGLLLASCLAPLRQMAAAAAGR